MSPFSPLSSTSSLLLDDTDMPLVDQSMQGFEELFNFDEFDSAAETNSHTHSPTTASPNHTPSPLSMTAQEPFTFNPTNSFNFLDADFPIDFAFGGETKAQSSEDVIAIKQEPMDFGFPDSSAVASSSQSPLSIDGQVRPVPVPQVLAIQPTATNADADVNSFAGLPIDQQLALHQLMNNILNYQKQFGLDMPSAEPAAPLPSTVQPSMVFNNVPSTQTLPAAAAPLTTNTFVDTASQAQVSPLAQHLPNMSENDVDAEPLRPVEAHEVASPGPSRFTRQDSTFSAFGDDLDSKLDRLVPLPAIFSAGKGKGGKKGGGLSSVVRGDDEDLDDDDSWRPSPEEYKKLTSKEKRQLRNKLSARAFRTRRKDYIGTLESHIKDRDIVIDEMRAELVNSRTENQDLRRELDALKSSTMSILHPETATKTTISPAMMNAFAMSPSLPANATAGPGPNTIRRNQTPLNTFNPRKDIPAASTKGFWGNDNILGGGSTICHTMFTPDLVLPSASTNARNPPPIRSYADLPRVNMNPMLNDDVTSRVHSLANVGNGKDMSPSFADWSETTPFSLRSMDNYRMQMWSRLAREAAADKAGLVGDLRPKFYVESPAASPAAADPAAAALATAAIATTHISSKLASSFWSAFQGSGKTLDTDKLAAVVTGTAKLKVVSTSTSPQNDEEASHDSLAALMGGLKLQSGPGLIKPATGHCLNVRENPLGALCGFLRHASTAGCGA